MIFVTLGTWEMPFVRPLVELERAAERGLLQEPIIVQCGVTTYASRFMKLIPFLTRSELEALYEQASLLICQAGVGSIMLGLKKKKKIIGIARRIDFNEHIDDHQLEILSVFADTGAVLPWRGAGDLEEVLGRVEDFIPTEYPFADERISAEILAFLGVSP
jgi:UDP-N-acetylglucosamine transferase subunit ALG13